MPTYVVTGPDGVRYRVTAPEGATEAQVRAQVQRQHGSGGSRPQPKSLPRQLGEAFVNDAAGLAEGVLALPDMLWDAATVTQRGVNKALDAGGGAALRAIGAPGAADWWERGGKAFDRHLATQERPSSVVSRTFPTPNNTAAKASRFASQLIGGALVPVPTPVKPPRLPKPVAPAKGVDMALVKAGERQRIPIRQPDAIPARRGAMAHAKAAPYSSPIVTRAMDADSAALQGRLAEIGGPGNVQSQTYNLGQQIQKVGTDFIERTGKQAEKAYREVDRLADGRRISPQNAIAAIDQNIAELNAVGGFTNSATIDYLKGLRGDLVKRDGFSVSEFQALRSAARKKIRGSAELTASDAERRLGNVVGAFSDDARQQIPKEASQLLDETDRFYADRMGFIKDVLQRHVLGSRNRPFSAEKAAANVTAMAKNRADYDTFTRFWGVADPKTRSDFAATLASNLGIRRNGEFGPGTLRTDIENIPSNLARTIYGRQGADDLADLRMIAGAKADTASGLNNSKTSDVLLRQVGPRVAGSAMTGYLMGGPLGAVAAPAVMEGGAAIGQLRNANKLLSTDFSKYGTAELPSLLDRVSLLAPRAEVAVLSNPTVRSEVGGLLASPYLSRLAADDTEKKKKKKR